MTGLVPVTHDFSYLNKGINSQSRHGDETKNTPADRFDRRQVTGNGAFNAA
jgi:hypothetical protein